MPQPKNWGIFASILIAIPYQPYQVVTGQVVIGPQLFHPPKKTLQKINSHLRNSGRDAATSRRN